MNLLLALIRRNAAIYGAAALADTVPAGLTAIPTGSSVTSLTDLVNNVLAKGESYTVSPGETLLVDMQMVTGTHSLGQLDVSQGGALFFDWRKSHKLIAAGIGNWGKVIRQIPWQRTSVVELNGAPPTVSGNPSALRGGVLSTTALSSIQALAGTLSITVGGTTLTSSPISLSGVASFGAAAARIQAAFASPTFAVTFDWSAGGLAVTTNVAGASAPTIGYAAGTLADALRLTQAAGATILAGGGSVVRGNTHANASGTFQSPANLSRGNNGTTNDYGGTSRGWIDYEGSEVVEEGMVGAPHECTWTRLDGDVQAGGYVLKVADPVSWRVGWKIVLGSTRKFGSGHKSQELTIAAISADGRTITTVEPFDDWRFGRLMYAVDALSPTDNGLSFTMDGRTFTEGADILGSNMKSGPEQTTNVIEMRAVVGVADGNMVDQAPADAYWTSATPLGFHRMRMGIASKSRIRHKHTRRYGHAGEQGRYGIHNHLNAYDLVTLQPRTNPLTGLSDGMFAPGQSVWEHLSFNEGANRALVLHTTRNSWVDTVYARDATGHAVLLETGAETKNTLRNIVGVEPKPAGDFALKIHEVSTPSGVWISNFDNFLFNYGGVGCAGGGFWHAPSRGIEATQPDRSFGCLNESAGLSIAPFYAKQGCFVDITTGAITSYVTDGGTAEGMFGEYCELIGRTNDFPTDNNGNTAQGKIQTTDNGLVGVDYGNPHQTATLLVGMRGHGCNGNYSNRISNPLYLRPVTSDIFKEHLFGQTDAGFRLGHIAVARSLYPYAADIVDRDGTPVIVATGYHGTFGTIRQSAWGFSGGPFAPVDDSAQLKGSAVTAEWDTYNEAVTDNYNGTPTDTGMKLCLSDAEFRTPSPNLIGTALYASTAGLFLQDATDPVRDGYLFNGQPMRRHFHLAGARRDRDGSLSSGSGRARKVGRPGYIVYKAPFLTYGAGALEDLPGDPFSANAIGPYFGVALNHDSGPQSTRAADGFAYSADPATNRMMTPLFQRLSAADLTRVDGAVWTMPGPGNGGSTISTNCQGGRNNQHFALVNGGWASIDFPEQPEGFDYLQLYFSNFWRSGEWMGLAIPWHGNSGVPRDIQHNTTSIPKAASKEACRTATSDAWWAENGRAYVKLFGTGVPPAIPNTATGNSASLQAYS